MSNTGSETQRIEGYINRHHRRRIAEHGLDALLLSQIKPTLEGFEDHELPAFRVSLSAFVSGNETIPDDPAPA